MTRCAASNSMRRVQVRGLSHGRRLRWCAHCRLKAWPTNQRGRLRGLGASGARRMPCAHSRSAGPWRARRRCLNWRRHGARKRIRSSAKAPPSPDIFRVSAAMGEGAAAAAATGAPATGPKGCAGASGPAAAAVADLPSRPSGTFHPLLAMHSLNSETSSPPARFIIA